ncbi:AGAP006080-PA-like protein [Anopheles sinensis]|uniref:AGAP006080-PA-like protein n=1 Tax=Anopheles sinensis TaxID=74873 RepID=A0A084WL97_ANOSI|nr:AGAP006080-PA-like protein [Anopheles sinensis]
MVLKQAFVLTFAIVCCSLQLASADEDCKNLLDRADEIDNCCQLESIIPMNEADNCSSTAEEASNPREKMTCVLQCELQSLGLMNGKQLVPEKVLEYANRFDGDWKAKAVEIANGCNERLANAKDNIDAKVQDKDCSPIGAFLMGCIMRRTFDVCPADKWQNTDFCNKIKSGECFKHRGRHA